MTEKRSPGRQFRERGEATQGSKGRYKPMIASVRERGQSDERESARRKILSDALGLSTDWMVPW